MEETVAFPQTLTQLEHEVNLFRKELNGMGAGNRPELEELLNVQMNQPSKGIISRFEDGDVKNTKETFSLLQKKIRDLKGYNEEEKWEEKSGEKETSLRKKAATYLSLVSSENRKRVENIGGIIRKYHPNLPDKKVDIFLSYAASDYTLAFYLYVWFCWHGIFLYVDYFQAPKLEGNRLRNNLRKNIQNSRQILFAATLASQIKLSGNYYIRPWCGWENGAFFSSHNNLEDSQFFANFFGPDTNGKTLNMKNSMTKEMKLVHKVDLNRRIMI